MIRCRYCNSDKVYKAGFYTTKKSKERRQMYRCKLCNRRFVLEQKRPKYPDDFKEKVVKSVVCNGMGVRQASRTFEISLSTVIRWVKDFHLKKP